MGTPEFSLPSLSLLAASRDFHVQLVVTVPDRPRERGMKLHPSPVKQLAQELSLPVYEAETLSGPDFIRQLAELASDFFPVVAFGYKIPNEVIEIPTHGCVNLHPSLLPRYRGAAPIQWALINGESITGVSTQFVAEAWDAGDLILQQSTLVEPDDNFETLSRRLAEQGAHLLLHSLTGIALGNVEPIRQDASRVTLARRIKKEQGRLQWTQPALALHNLIRGLTPRPGAYTYYQGKRIKLYTTAPHPKRRTPGRPGEVVSLRFNDRVIVKTGKGDLVVETLQPEGSSPMAARDFINGYRIRVGDRFTTEPR